MRDDTRREVGSGVATGTAAYVLGYLVTYLLTAEPLRRSIAQRLVQFLTGEPATWKMVGWAFYNAHFVRTYVPGPFGRNTVNLVAQSSDLTPALYALPVILLVVAGGLAAELGDAEEAAAGAKAGASVTLAYLPLAVVGAFLFRISLGDATAGPVLVTAALLAGLVYPVVCGTLGGWGRVQLR
ncbi:MAG: transporter [Haloferacaceae archaeon]